MSELPAGWVRCKLDDVILDYQPGFASGKKDVADGLKHLRMNNISVDGKLNLDLVRTVPRPLASQRHFLRKGDVLICTTNSGKLVGKSTLMDIDGEFAFSNHLTRLRANTTVEGKFLQYQLWLQWKEGAFEHKCKHWVNQSTLPKVELLSTDFLTGTQERTTSHRVEVGKALEPRKCGSRATRYHPPYPQTLPPIRPRRRLFRQINGRLATGQTEQDGLLLPF